MEQPLIALPLLATLLLFTGAALGAHCQLNPRGDLWIFPGLIN